MGAAILTPSVFKLTTDAGFEHAGAKGAGVESENGRRPVFSLDAPAGLLEHLADMIVFHGGEGFELLAGRLLRGSGRREAIQHLQCGAGTGDDGSDISSGDT